MKRGHRGRRWAAMGAVTFALGAAGCGNGPESGITVETADSAGVQIVRSVSPDVALTLGSEPVRSLGGKETDEESFYRVGSWNVGADGKGRIFVLDRESHRVQVFDSSGIHVRSLGGEGGGPGELQFPFGLSVAPDGRAWVVDIGKRALVHWGPGGEVLDAPALPDRYAGGDVEWTPSGIVVPLRDEAGQRLELIGGGGATDTIASIPAGEVRALQLESCGMGFTGMPPIFAPTMTWAAAADRIVVARNPEYAIDVYEGGRLVRSIRRDVAARPATAELARASLGEGMKVTMQGRGQVVCDPEEVVEKQGFAPFLPAVAGVVLGPDGTLWARRYGIADEPVPVDLFDAAGRYLGTLPAGSPFPVGFLPDGRILVSEKDDMDVERLVVRTAEFPWT